jgi:putative ABC transport system permease protein/lipoprotein-releasing system permease protein
LLVITLAVMLIAGIVALMNSIPLSVTTIYSYSRYSLGVSPRGDQSQLDEIRQRLVAGTPAPIERIVVCRANTAMVDSIVGKWPFVVFGFEQPDMRYYVQKLGAELAQGRYPVEGEPEAVVSQPVATNLGLRVGDVLLGPDKPDSYSPKEVRVVGILETPEWIMFMPIEYHRVNHYPPVDVLLVFAHNLPDQTRLDEWALEEFKGDRARLYAFKDLKEQTDSAFKTLYTILNVVVASLVVVLTVMMGMLMNIYQSQRTNEFGLLQALGYGKRTILSRVLAEILVVLAGSWLLGVIVAFALLMLVKTQLFDPRAYALDPTDPSTYLYSTPVPVMIFLVAALDFMVRLKRFDPVGVVERRLL